jgi:hypothetical protein
MNRIWLIISNIRKKKSVAQTGDFGILLSAVMSSISTAMRLRYLLHTKAVLTANLLRHQVPLSSVREIEHKRRPPVNKRTFLK